MAQEYKIGMIDGSEPRKWSGPNGDVFYITVGLEGHPKLVSIGKKSPDALKVGDTVYGTIVPTDYLTDKWKGEAPPQGSGGKGGGGSENKFQRDVTAIPLDVWRTLIGIQGVPTNQTEFHRFFETVKLHANELLATIETVRSGETKEPEPTEPSKEVPSLKDSWNQTKGTKVVGWANDLPPSDEDNQG